MLVEGGDRAEIGIGRRHGQVVGHRIGSEEINPVVLAKVKIVWFGADLSADYGTSG